MSGVKRIDRGGERGAALLMVLVIVATMSVVAVGASAAVSVAARRGANVATHNQAIWYAHGAEALARAALERSYALDGSRTTLMQPWATGPLRFEVEGGVIEGELVDAGNCFNINALAIQADGRARYVIDDAAKASLLTLLQTLEIETGVAERLVDGAADWIDADQRARSHGAEDYDYAFADPPYRAANATFADIDELRGVAGVTEGVFRAVRPFLCVGEPNAPGTLNVNTLRPHQAALLTALFDGELDLIEARRVLEDRPGDGWADLDAFWALDPVSEISVEDHVKERVVLRTSHFELHARVRYYDSYVETHTLFRQGDGGDVRLIRRRLGDAS